MTNRKRLFIAGHTGMVGSALSRLIEQDGSWTVLTVARSEVDLMRQAETEAFLAEEKPDAVIVAAARVGGIHANATYPAEFIHDNLAIASHIIHGSWKAEVERLLFLGSSCIYPKLAAQPISETELLTGSLEESNEAYAIAKIAGLKLCEFYRRQYGVTYHSAMPTNLYGPGDSYHPENSHVIPALIRRFHDATARGDDEVTIWGSGTPLREFLHVDDLAQACLCLIEAEEPPDLVNIGTGKDLTIFDLAKKVAEVTGFAGTISTDPSRPDGTPRKLLDVSRMNAIGWRAQVSLSDGLRDAYQAFLEEGAAGTLRA